MVMVAHLNIPALDSSANSVSTLSYAIVTDLLKKELGYNGLIECFECPFSVAEL